MLYIYIYTDIHTGDSPGSEHLNLKATLTVYVGFLRLGPNVGVEVPRCGLWAYVL